MAFGQPGTNQRGFPKASGGRDERQFAVQPLVEPLDQPGTENNVWPKRRNVEFRGKNWHHVFPLLMAYKALFSLASLSHYSKCGAIFPLRKEICHDYRLDR